PGGASRARGRERAGVTRVKVCGIRRHEDARLAVELGADALGFIFWPDSPRFIDPLDAETIVAQIPALVAVVGVFVDQPVAFVTDVARGLKLTAVQLHGHEQVEDYQHLPQRLVKAVAVGAANDAARAIEGLAPEVTVLLDAHDPIKRGGTGRTIDWAAAARFAAARPVILSGGLTADNVGDAVEAVRPYAVDVSSGVESRPGEKDARKMRAFFAALAAPHVNLEG
ncbi:MAG TPA: phosphoribosylanthranilate isomerase, partial [Vicinamibacterales bacterium]|nr:phosphoribosylanthranilate isomerase [Vicinamibacterales bacterium]